MALLAVGLALLPTAVLTMFVAVRTLGRLAWHSPSAWPFTAGAVLALLLWLAGLCAAGLGRGLPARTLLALRWIYVFGHEFTHALAAWAMGAEVHAMEVRSDGGHVDMSRSGALISLAPYCLPVYTAAVVIGCKALLWLRPGCLSLSVFWGLVGLTLAGHLLMTGECLWTRRQPDLAAAGGIIFSLAVIAIVNGWVVLLLAKALFPHAVSLLDPLRQVAAWSRACWLGSFKFLKDLFGPILARYPA